MDLAALGNLVKQGEGLKLEFKKFLPEPLRIIREAAAFANTKGGQILLGVDDDGSITGIKDVEEGAEFFRQASEKYCKSSLQYELLQVPLSRKRSVLIITIPKSEVRPLLCFENGSERGIFYFRVEDRSIQGSKELAEILKHDSKPHSLKIEIREKEKLLLEYLGEHEKITLKKFMEFASISRNTASRTLVHLVKGNVLGIEPEEGEDFFFAVQEPNKG